MKKRFILFVSGLFITFGCFSQPANINLSNSLFFGGEPYLAVNPLNSLNMVVAWMALDASTGFRMSIKSKASFDGGETWDHPFIQPHFGTTWGSADVTMQFRSDGSLYLCYIDYRQALPDSGGVFITHSADGGISWTDPVRVWNALTEDPEKRPLDRPWLAIDNSGTSNDGVFYLTTKPAPWIFPPNRPYLKTSYNSGQTWNSFRYIDTLNFLAGNLIASPMPAPAITADGALCVAYPSYLPSQSVFPKFILAKSTNRGISFQYHDLLINPVSVSDTLYKLAYHLAANPVHANQLAFTYIAQPFGDPDIFLTSTNDGGLTWNTPVRVNDDLTGNGKAQDMVWADYDPNDKLVVTWRDRRNASGTGFYQSSDTYCAVSDNNGLSFLPNVRLSTISAPFDSILQHSGNDFLSCSLNSDTIYAAWGDVRSGNLNIYFAKISDTSGTGIPIVLIDGNGREPFSFYPNPSHENLFITIHNSDYRQVGFIIENGMGQEVLKKPVENNKVTANIDVSSLVPGVYIIRMLAGGETVSDQKLIIVK